MIGPIISPSYSSHITCKHVFTLLFPPPSTPPHVDPAPPPPLPTHTTEAVVLLDCMKKHDDELSLKMGDVITNVEQVCEPHNLYCSQLPYIEQHNGEDNLAMKMLHVTHHMIVNRKSCNVLLCV